jgi:septal ring factor EnvC (AmiA/AmiB activator)
MTKSAKPKTAKDWEKVCGQLNDVIHAQHADEQKLEVQIANLEQQIGKLEEQLTMSVGVIKYLELQIVRSNPVRSDKDRA